MKSLPRILSAILLAALISPAVSAQPALVSMLDQCTVGWLSADPLDPAALPDVVAIRGSGVGVVANPDRGITQFHCQAFLDFSQPVMALNFWNGDPVMVNLAGFEDLCTTLGLCRQGQGGALIIDGSSGFTCNTALGPTSDFQEVVSPSGEVSLVCRLPARGRKLVEIEALD